MSWPPSPREVLAFAATAEHEPRWWREKAVRARWGISVARYNAELHRLLDDPKTLLIDPPLVSRLLRIRERRRSVRMARRVA